MPELPEVEYTRKNLDRWMRGATIDAAIVRDPKAVKPSASSFARGVEGRKVRALDRRGKWLRFTLDDGALVFAHLGMTGWFELAEAGGVARRFERVAFDLSRRGKKLRVSYVDARRLGGLALAHDDTKTWKKVGPDPLLEGIDVARLRAELAVEKTRSIKEVLLDQTVLAGIGNIQSVEALWKAGIDPRSRASKLAAKDVAALARGLRWTIDRTLADLASRGTAAETLVSAGAKNPFTIYGRKGTPCPRCKATLARIELGGRTTTFCPGCQKRR